MDPATLAMIISAVQAAAQGVGGTIAADKIYSVDDKANQDELQRRAELGTLGFSETEKQEILRGMLNPVQVRERERAVETRNLLGSMDQSAAASNISKLIQSDKGEAARAQVGEKYIEQNIEEKRLQEEQLSDLKKLKLSEDAAIEKAWLDALGIGAEKAAGVYQQDMLNKEEAQLVISSMTYDTQGNWGDGRQEKINSLILKLLREFNVQE